MKSLAGASAVEFAAAIVLTLTVIGIPFAVWWFVRTSFFAQASVLERASALNSLRVSAELTRRRWLRTFMFTVVVDVLAVMSGPLLGVLILLLTSSSLTFIDITSSIVYTLTVPWAAISLTLYYFDLQATHATETVPSADVAPAS